MKKNSLFLLLIMSLVVIIPANVKAFQVNPAGYCNIANNPNGAENAVCYIGSNRHVTFITENGNTSNNYFCLNESTELGPSTYSDTPVATYTDNGFACAVHELLRSGDISLSDLSNGYFNFGTVTPDNYSNYTVSTINGSALTYYKIQMKMWDLGKTATCSKYVEPTQNPTIKLTAGTLTENGEYYYSKITVTKSQNVNSYNVTLQNQPQGTLISTNQTAAGAVNGTNLTAGEFYILIPASSAANAVVTVNAVHNYNDASVSATVTEYSPVSIPTNQVVGRLNLAINSTPKSVSAQVKVALNPVIDFKVCKKDSKTNNPMSGVKFGVTSADAAVSFEVTTGADGCATKENVKQAKYTVTEITTPNGYVKSANKSIDCTQITGTTCLYNAVNTPITLKVKKLDDSGEALVDAKMQILDKDGNVFDEWTSVLEDHIVNKNIPFGKYTLREEEAPAGYVIATEIEFEIKEDSYVVGNETKQYGDDAIVTVTMIDKVTKVSILKTNAETGEPLVGAVLRIEKEDGTVVGEEWTTDGTPKVFTKMAVGTYYLVEVSAPEGYILQEERQPFTISQSSPEQEIIIENHKVPSTAANKSALLISFAMLDIALGISIILYVRKRKITE